jgi:hypothetical protein
MSFSIQSGPKASERREWPRYAGDRQVTLSVETAGKFHPCSLGNISLGGACLTFLEGVVPETSDLMIRHAGIGPVKLERRWRDGATAGVLFDFSEDSLALVQDCLQQIMGLGQHPRGEHA